MSLSSADRQILDRVRALVTRALIDEHCEHPFGPHSPQLTEVLHFLRRGPDPALPIYCVLCVGTPPLWMIGVKPAAREGQPLACDAATHASRGDAEHAVFLRRLRDYGLHEPSPGSEPPVQIMDSGGLMGYVDALSVAPGESVSLHVHSTAARWRGQLVRLLCADMAPEGPPLREEIVERVEPFERDGVAQLTPVGSYVRVSVPDDGIDFTTGLGLRVLVMPTLPGEGAQALISHRDAGGRSGWSLRLNRAGIPSLWVGADAGSAMLELDAPLVRGCWYAIAAVIDPAGGRLALSCRPVGTRAANRVWLGRGSAQSKTAQLAVLPHPTSGAPLLLASGWLDADRQPQESFDGRLEQPMLVSGALDVAALLDRQTLADFAASDVLAAWDFSAGIGPYGFSRPSHVTDGGPHAWHGQCVNHPMRAVTSHGWDGGESNFRHAPQDYAAAHFHRDDMTDCAWRPQATIKVPHDLPSGVYAFRLTAGDAPHEPLDRVPLIVRPPRDRATAPILLVLPTNSYLAYANDHVGVDSPRIQMLIRRVVQFDEFALFRHRHREIGASLYEAHLDGSGICYSSWRRPILTMRPHVKTFNGRAWQFTADMQIVDWLDRTGRTFDVVSDLDVDREGRALLSRYKCVMTGTHPEYATLRMLDAFADYTDGGGRFIYFGGNGLYWVTGYDPEDDQVIEIRRWGGTEAWRAKPGEYHLSSTGELGGLWRNRGRAPQKLTGVGFVAAGLTNAGASYRRSLSPDSPAGWIFEGVAGETFGGNGTVGPAAGLEIDAVDVELGTPAGTIVLASSGGRHGDDMLEARENYGMTLAAAGGGRNPRVRSDMVLVPGAGGGGVFSTGSIAWAGALAHDEDISRILSNVVDRFCSDRPLLD
jgi:N,N-dimethylformamidase